MQNITSCFEILVLALSQWLNTVSVGFGRLHINQSINQSINQDFNSG